MEYMIAVFFLCLISVSILYYFYIQNTNLKKIKIIRNWLKTHSFKYVNKNIKVRISYPKTLWTSSVMNCDCYVTQDCIYLIDPRDKEITQAVVIYRENSDFFKNFFVRFELTYCRLENAEIIFKGWAKHREFIFFNMTEAEYSISVDELNPDLVNKAWFKGLFLKVKS